MIRLITLTLMLMATPLAAGATKILKDGHLLEFRADLQQEDLVITSVSDVGGGPMGGRTMIEIEGMAPDYKTAPKTMVGMIYPVIPNVTSKVLHQKGYTKDISIQARALTLDGTTRLLIEGWEHRESRDSVSTCPPPIHKTAKVTGAFDGDRTLNICDGMYKLMPNALLGKLRKVWAKGSYAGVTLKGHWIDLGEGKAFLITEIGRKVKTKS